MISKKVSESSLYDAIHKKTPEEMIPLEIFIA